MSEAMGQQQRLFRLAVDAICIHAFWEGGDGWRLVVRARRPDEQWREAGDRTYTHLTSAELEDVVAADLAGILSTRLRP